MTRRERMEARANKREKWADKARQVAAQKFKAADAAVEGIPFGQPILTDHHSAPRHRAALKRCETNMHAGIERTDMAHRHEQVADTLRDNLDRSIFSDDENAIAALEARITEREAQCARVVELNRGLRRELKEGSGKLLAGAFERLACTPEEIKDIESNARYGGGVMFPAYVNANKRNLIRADRQRIATIKHRAAQSERAVQAGGVLVREYMPGRVQVVFAAKPRREVLNALKAAGFFWSGGAWNGAADKLPAEVRPDSTSEPLTGEVRP